MALYAAVVNHHIVQYASACLPAMSGFSTNYLKPQKHLRNFFNDQKNYMLLIAAVFSSIMAKICQLVMLSKVTHRTEPLTDLGGEVCEREAAAFLPCHCFVLARVKSLLRCNNTGAESGGIVTPADVTHRFHCFMTDFLLMRLIVLS